MTWDGYVLREFCDNIHLEIKQISCDEDQKLFKGLYMRMLKSTLNNLHNTNKYLASLISNKLKIILEKNA